VPKIDAGSYPRDIRAAHDTLRQRHQTRIDQQLEDEKLWRLERYILEELATLGPMRAQDFPSFTGNGPRVFANVVITALNKWPVGFRGDTYQAEGESEQDEISAHERFAEGLWRTVDDVRARRVEMAYQWDMAWYHAIRGGSVQQMWLDQVREDPFDANLFDPIECVWEVGADDLVYFSRQYMAEKYDVEDRWNTTVKAAANGSVEVWNAWWRDRDGHVWNSVVTGSEELKKATDHTALHKQKRIPVIVTRVSGAPIGEKVQERGDKTYMVDRWDSIYAPNRTMYAWKNRIASLFSIYIRNGAVGPWVSIGQKIPNIAQAMRPFRILEKPDGSFGPASMPEMAREAKEFFSFVQGEEQRGSVPASVYGQLPFELTGVAISQLQGAIDIVLDPQRNAMKSAYRAATEEAIRQYIARGRTMKLRGIDRRGQPWWEDFNRQRLSKKYWLDVEVRADLPLLRQQEATIAGFWQKLGVSLLTIYDELLHFKDPNAEYRRWLAEQADKNPVVAGLKMAELLGRNAQAAREMGRPDEAARLEKYAQIVLQQIGQAQTQVAQATGGPPGLPPPELGSPEMMGRQTGEFVPSEQHVGMEDRMRAAGLIPAGG